MKKILKFSILKYSPILSSGEEIILGIIFSEEAIGYHSFYYIQDLDHIKFFDDKLDLSILKDLLVGIKEEVDGEWFDKDFNINSFIKFYINDYKFDDLQIIEYQDLEKAIVTLKKIYF